MGTTSTAIRTQSGVELAYVLVIEGYKYLLTDGLPSKAVAAWAGTLWTDALPGLQVSGSMSQSLRPWSNEPSVPSMTFSVLGDNSTDQFATDVFRKKPTNRSELTVGFGTGTSVGGGFNLTMKKPAAFTGGVVHIGTETFKTGTPVGFNLPVLADGAGVYAPFSTNTGTPNIIPQPHNLPPNENINTFESNAPVYVSDSPTEWVGKKVALYVHRVTAGVLDLKAQAQLWFAGTISEVSEGDMTTDLQCTGIQQAIIDSEVLSDQWTGRLKEGYIFQTGDMLRVRVTRGDTNTTVGGSNTDYVCGTSAGFTAGRYTVEEISSALVAHLDADSELGESSTISLRWSAGVVPTLDGMKWQIAAQRGTTLEMFISLIASSEEILNFLGFDSGIAPTGGSGLPSVRGDYGVTDTDVNITSGAAPLRYPTIATGVVKGRSIQRIELEDSDGTFFDQTAMLPAQAQERISAGQVWALYMLGDSVLFLGQRESETSIIGITADLGLPRVTLRTDEVKQNYRIGDGRSLRVKQVLMITGTFSEIITKLFASIDGSGTNHADYDVFPFGAGIPWGLLGDNFLDSLKTIEQAGAEDAMTLIVEKPTKLWDVIKSDFVLRMAGVIWKDSGLQVAQLGVPNASTADHTLSEANKSDERRTVPRETDEFQTHTIKIAYNRNPLKDEYTDNYIVRSKSGYENAGKTGKTKTIKARNSYGGVLGTGASVEALGDMLGSRWLPVLAKPMKTWTRSIPHTLFHMAPGDTVAITDDRVRNPNTGARGVESRACTVLSVSHSLGISSGGQGYHGEVELLYSEEDRLYGLSPSCESYPGTTTATGRNWTSGWDATAKSLLVHSNKFTASTTTDVAKFASAAVVRIIEVDPVNSAAADTFTDTIASVDETAVTVTSVNYGEVVLTNGFGVGGRPAYSASKLYYINAAEYGDVTAAQKLYAYQCDDADGEILDTIDPNLCGDQFKRGGSKVADLTLLPARHSAQQYGDGVPLSASFVRDQIRKANSLVNHRTGNHSPFVASNGSIITSAIISGATYVEIWTRPMLIGGGLYGGTRRRVFSVAPQFASTDGTSCSIRITSAANPPMTGPGTDGPTWVGPKKQVTFSTTSTATWSVATAQDLDVVRAAMDLSMTWITVEATVKSDIIGVPEFWLKEQA